jgi:hypothetical protein
MEPQEAYEKIKDIYQKAQEDIDALAAEHSERVQEIIEASDQKRIEEVRKKIKEL